MNESSHVTVTDVQIPFWSMVVLILKWTLASIPALIILAVGAIVVGGMLGGMMGLGGY